ncbi:MAG: PAS domain-containing protein, partial [Acidiferrobacterales bacterium]|nr:PAS domain-containing protein [Acidiferrobacterales bacterium]
MVTQTKLARPNTSADTLWELLDALPMRVSFIDRTRRHRYVNREYAEFIGLSAEQILGKTLAEIYGHEEDARLTPLVDAALRGESVQWEGWVKSPARADRYVRRVYKPHSTNGKDIDGYFALVRDITEHRHAEDEQRRLTQLLRDAIENIPNGFAIYDAHERLTLCNTAFAVLYSTDPTSLVGVSLTDLIRRAQLRMRRFDGIPVDERLSLEHILQRLRDADREPVEIELETGQWLQITSHSTADGGRVFIRTDITRLKNVE